MGISGGEEGARNGPSLMPGGPREAFDALEPIITKCAAQISSTITDKDNKTTTDVSACTTYLGTIGSGNYVKMIHNGIEYGDMQLIAESYDVLKQIVGLSNEEILVMGDDIPDIPIIKAAGIGCCPQDAVPEVKAAANYVSQKNGGNGCVRDVIEQVMKIQNKWI